MTRYAQSERDAIADTFERVGPAAPTLCPPWLTRDLAVHLVIRDRRPDASMGIVVPFLASWTESVQDDYAGKDWPELVHLVRSGPPLWSPAHLGLLDEATNLTELFIHHEDVLRGAGSWRSRPLPDGMEQALWGVLGRLGRLTFRRSPVGVVLEAPSIGRVEVRADTATGSVVLHGTPGDLTLYASGRQRVADVSVDGPDPATKAFADTTFGLS